MNKQEQQISTIESEIAKLSNVIFDALLVCRDLNDRLAELKNDKQSSIVNSSMDEVKRGCEIALDHVRRFASWNDGSERSELAAMALEDARSLRMMTKAFSYIDGQFHGWVAHADGTFTVEKIDIAGRA